MQGFSESMIRDLWSDAPEPAALLVTLSAAGLATPIRVTDWKGELSGDKRGGMVSNSNTFLFFPFSFSFGGAGPGQPARDARLEIANVAGEIAQAVRGVTGGQPTMTVQMVRVAAPNTVELALTDALVTDVEIDDPKAVATLRPRDFAGEPACHARYISARTPALF